MVLLMYFAHTHKLNRNSQVAQRQRTCLTMQEMQEMQVPSLGGENPLEEVIAALFSILAGIIPWTEEPGGLQSMGSQKSQTQLNNWAHTHRLNRLEIYVIRAHYNYMFLRFLLLSPETLLHSLGADASHFGDPCCKPWEIPFPQGKQKDKRRIEKGNNLCWTHCLAMSCFQTVILPVRPLGRGLEA